GRGVCPGAVPGHTSVNDPCGGEGGAHCPPAIDEGEARHPGADKVGNSITAATATRTALGVDSASRCEDAHGQGDQHLEEPTSPLPLAGPAGRAWPAISSRIGTLCIHHCLSGSTDDSTPAPSARDRV